MVAFILLTLAFLLLLGVVCGALYRLLRADTIRYDRDFLWKGFPITAESIEYRK